MPEGLASNAKRDPMNLTLEEWQQTKRIGKDPRAIKTAILDAWAISDSKFAFMHALEERGYLLARIDRAAIVAVDIRGETYSVSRLLPKEVKVEDVRARIGDEDDLPSVAMVKEQISQGMLQALDRFNVEADETLEAQTHAFEYRRNMLVQWQRLERQT